jgi:hypothetical protein
MSCRRQNAILWEEAEDSLYRIQTREIFQVDMVPRRFSTTRFVEM